MLLPLLAFTTFHSLILGQYLPSPCPKYFKYVKDGTTTYGVIEVPSIQLGQSLKVNAHLSLKAKLHGVSYSKFSFNWQ